MAFDRQRAEQLNADHHRRMRLEAARAAPGQAGRDRQSRAKLVRAMKGCVGRFKLPRPKAELLELGAGYGGDRLYLLEELNLTAYVGVEVVKDVADRSEHVTHMAFEEMPEVWNGRFEYVYSRHVMEHATDAREAIRAIKRVLAPTGVVAAVTPHYFPDPEPAHVTQLRVEEWMDLYRSEGLEPVYAMKEDFACAEAHLVLLHAGAVQLP